VCLEKSSFFRGVLRNCAPILAIAQDSSNGLNVVQAFDDLGDFGLFHSPGAIRYLKQSTTSVRSYFLSSGFSYTSHRCRPDVEKRK